MGSTRSLQMRRASHGKARGGGDVLPPAGAGPGSHSAAGARTRLLVDGHVHVHAGYDRSRFLSAAADNLSRFGDGLPTLLLAEMGDDNVFEGWRGGDAPWPLTRTDEGESLFLGSRMLVVAGRQIVTAERIEVLALLTAEHFPDGRPLSEILEAIKAAGAIAVLPWGVGKWLGRRGREVAAAAARHEVFMGDNAGRPVGWPAPKPFRERPVLPGTDPLRLPGQEGVVGTFGFAMLCDLDARRPAATIRAALRNLEGSPDSFGRRTGPIGFVRQQIGLRLKQ